MLRSHIYPIDSLTVTAKCLSISHIFCAIDPRCWWYDRFFIRVRDVRWSDRLVIVKVYVDLVIIDAHTENIKNSSSLTPQGRQTPDSQSSQNNMKCGDDPGMS